MLDNTTLEIIVIFVVTAGAAAGIAISTSVRDKRSKRSKGRNREAKSVAPVPEPSNASVEEIFLEHSPESSSLVEQSDEQSHEPSWPPITPAELPQVNFFETTPQPQYKKHQRTVGSEIFDIESLVVEQSSSSIGSHIDSLQEETPPDRNDPTSNELAQSPPITTHAELSREPVSTPSIALPTDSVAMEKITAAPLPIAPQTVSLSDITAPAAMTSNAPSAYCVKCKSKKQMKNPTPVTMKNGRPALSGFCSHCGTRVFRIGKLQVLG